MCEGGRGCCAGALLLGMWAVQWGLAGGRVLAASEGCCPGIRSSVLCLLVVP